MKLNEKQIESLTKKAFRAGQKEAVRVSGVGYDRKWKDNGPAHNAGFIAFTKYVIENHRKASR